MDALDSNALSILAFIVSALIVGAGSAAVWVWRRRGNHGADPPEHWRS
jgi:hypothetical protein